MFVSFIKNGENTDELIEVAEVFGKPSQGYDTREAAGSGNKRKEGTKSDDSFPFGGGSLKEKPNTKKEVVKKASAILGKRNRGTRETGNR